MIVCILSKASTCIVNACEDVSPNWDTEPQNTMQSEKNKDDYSTSLSHCKPREQNDRQADQHNTVKNSDENSNKD